MTTAAAPRFVDQAALDDLRLRIDRYRRVPVPDTASGGTDGEHLDRVLDAWRSHDVLASERRLAELPWVTGGAADAPVRAVHQRSADPSAPVVLLLHGWPDSVLRFTRVLPLLADHTVVVPALPGYPFAHPTDRRIRSAADMASAIADLMHDLGHERFVVSAGDVGADVAEHLAARWPERVAALHLTDLPHHNAVGPRATALAASGALQPEETAYLDAIRRWHEDAGAYNHEQATRPATLAVGLGDSPAGLAAWILEKLRDWSDCDGDVERAFPMPDLLDWLGAYWFTGSIGTSFSPYAHREEPGPITAPVVCSVFPRNIVNAPRSYVERFLDVRDWRAAPGGGHFDAWEQPEAYAAGVRAAVALAR